MSWTLYCAYFGVGLCFTRLGSKTRVAIGIVFICGFITTSCLEASLCRYFVFWLSTIIRSCRAANGNSGQKPLKKVLEFFDILLLPITQFDLLHRPWCSYFFVRHIDFRLKQLSYMLGNCSFEPIILKSIKADVFFVHFPFICKDYAEIVLLHGFSSKIRRHHPRFRWRHVISGWNFFFISASSDAELVPQGLGESAFLHSYGSRRYSRKNWGRMQLCISLAVRGLTNISHSSVLYDSDLDLNLPLGDSDLNSDLPVWDTITTLSVFILASGCSIKVLYCSNQRCGDK